MANRKKSAVRPGQLWRERYGRQVRGGVKRSLVIYSIEGLSNDPKSRVCYYLWNEKTQQWTIPNSSKKTMMIHTLHEQWDKVGEDHVRIVDFRR